VSLHSVLAQCPCTVSLHSVPAQCPCTVPCTVSLHSVPSQCPCTVSLHSVRAQCPCTVSLHSVLAQCPCTVSLHSANCCSAQQSCSASNSKPRRCNRTKFSPFVVLLMTKAALKPYSPVGGYELPSCSEQT